jgi:chemotaxis protein MotB
MTFADLMSLLMCFFVLLLSFSEMDLLKFKQIAGSMEFAFGVQREIKVRDIPKGTSVVKKEFSPGKPEPTPLNVVRQDTTDRLKRLLKTDDQTGGGPTQSEQTREELLQALAEKAREDAEKIKQAFQDQLNEGLIDIETDQERIIIRIQEKGSFPSGSADMKSVFAPVLAQIGQVLTTTDGKIIVAGHTDNIPISTQRFRSNWELSAARAVTVVHHLKKVAGLTEDRFLIEGHADSHPLEPNESAEARARNRRVEIVIVKGTEQVQELASQALERANPAKS